MVLLHSVNATTLLYAFEHRLPDVEADCRSAQRIETTMQLRG